MFKKLMSLFIILILISNIFSISVFADNTDNNTTFSYDILLDDTVSDYEIGNAEYWETNEDLGIDENLELNEDLGSDENSKNNEENELVINRHNSTTSLESDIPEIGFNVIQYYENAKIEKDTTGIQFYVPYKSEILIYTERTKESDKTIYDSFYITATIKRGTQTITTISNNNSYDNNFTEIVTLDRGIHTIYLKPATEYKIGSCNLTLIGNSREDTVGHDFNDTATKISLGSTHSEINYIGDVDVFRYDSERQSYFEWSVHPSNVTVKLYDFSGKEVETKTGSTGYQHGKILDEGRYYFEISGAKGNYTLNFYNTKEVCYSEVGGTWIASELYGSATEYKVSYIPMEIASVVANCTQYIIDHPREWEDRLSKIIGNVIGSAVFGLIEDVFEDSINIVAAGAASILTGEMIDEIELGGDPMLEFIKITKAYEEGQITAKYLVISRVMDNFMDKSVYNFSFSNDDFILGGTSLNGKSYINGTFDVDDYSVFILGKRVITHPIFSTDGLSVSSNSATGKTISTPLKLTLEFEHEVLDSNMIIEGSVNDGIWIADLSNIDLYEGQSVIIRQTKEGLLTSEGFVTKVTSKLLTEPPFVNAIHLEDNHLTGTGIPDAQIIVQFTNNHLNTKVKDNGTWSFDITNKKGLVEEGTLFAFIQNEYLDEDKVPSNPVYVNASTIELPEISEAPYVFPVRRLAPLATGYGVPYATITVIWPAGDMSTAIVDSDGMWSVPTPIYGLYQGQWFYVFQTEPGKIQSGEVIGHVYAD